MNQCVLGGYTYPVNPVENQNPAVRAVSTTETLGGRYYTDWGAHPSRREITQTWPTMETAMFAALEAKSLLGGTLPYTHSDGVIYTVVALPPTYQKQTPGGPAYVSVSFKLLVVSSP